MSKTILSMILMIMCLMTSWAADKRHMDAHEHGVGQLMIAFESDRTAKERIAIELEVPGADIVGFEHPAGNDQERMAIKNALAMLNSPIDLFAFPQQAKCEVVKVNALLVGSQENDEGDEHEAEDDHHTEFHCEYEIICHTLNQVNEIVFHYFSIFPNTQELEVTIVDNSGAVSYKVERDDPILYLGH